MKRRASRPRRAHLMSACGSWQMSRLVDAPSFPEGVFERRKLVASFGGRCFLLSNGWWLRPLRAALTTTTWVVRSAPRRTRGRTCDRPRGSEWRREPLGLAGAAWAPARRSCPGAGVDARRVPAGLTWLCRLVPTRESDETPELFTRRGLVQGLSHPVAGAGPGLHRCSMTVKS